MSGSKSVQIVELLLIIFEMSENYEGNLFLGTFLFFHIIFFHVRKMRKPALRGDYFSLPLLHVLLNLFFKMHIKKLNAKNSTLSYEYFAFV